MKTVVIVGGSHSGISAATYLVKSKRFRVIILEQSDNVSFVGAEALLWVSGKLTSSDHLGYTNPEKLAAKGIDLRLNALVTEIDCQQKTVTYRSIAAGASQSNKSEGTVSDSADAASDSAAGAVSAPTANATSDSAAGAVSASAATAATSARTSGEISDQHWSDPQPLNYDYLILATGSSARRPQITNSFHKYVQTMKNLADGLKLKALADNPALAEVAVIGGGYIGVETAEALTVAGKRVTIYQSGSQLLTGFYDPEFIDLLEQQLGDHQVKIVYNSRVESIDSITADAFIFSLGFAANSQLGGDQLKRQGPAGPYLVDQYQQTNQADVYAIGDAAGSINNITGRPAYYALGSNTATTALVCSNRILGLDTPNLGRQGANAIEVFGLKFCSVGFCESTAVKAGLQVKSAGFCDRLKQDDFTENNDQVHIRIVYEIPSRKLIGVQIASFTDVTQVLHLFSLAIQEGLTIDRIKYLDMFFNPQLNKLFNFVFCALRNA